ncbi:MAG TPA: MBL fold metallo-hydrolase [Pyrinomonadaceae bacterium]|nr:MBL fold metallo-hydrolase [Pyrinomonadaceae bacterium]
MLVSQIEDDAYVLIGKVYQSNSTVFVSHDEVLLVDAMGSKADAEKLREFVEVELKKKVAFIVSTHFFTDHMAGLNLFPQARVIAHKDYLDTFNSELYRSEEETAHFREPDILVSDQMQIRWGKYALDIFHNPGHTSSTLGIDVKPVDLLMVGDTLVGNIVYLAYSTPERFVHALEKLQARARSRVLSSHGNVRSSAAIGNAQFYLKSLAERTREARNSSVTEKSLLEAPLEIFLPAGVEATAFEKMFHARNLNTILERNLFTR